MPVPVARSDVVTALDRATAALEPADPKIVATLVAQTMALYGVPPNWGEIAGFYLEALEDVPAGLAALAAKRVRQFCKFVPKPADFRTAIAEDLATLLIAKNRLRHALWVIDHANARGAPSEGGPAA
jgi:hypothetical protein